MLQLILLLFNVVIHKGFVECVRDVVMCWTDSIIQVIEDHPLGREFKRKFFCDNFA